MGSNPTPSAIQKKEESMFGAKHILVHSLNEAVTLREAIVNGTPFEEAALDMSLCPSRISGGDFAQNGF